jgi:hypothetical protein
MFRRVASERADFPEELGATETTVLTSATRRNIPEDTILQMKICLLSFVELRSKQFCDLQELLRTTLACRQNLCLRREREGE